MPVLFFSIKFYIPESSQLDSLSSVGSNLTWLWTPARQGSALGIYTSCILTCHLIFRQLKHDASYVPLVPSQAAATQFLHALKLLMPAAVTKNPATVA
jgi:hypothetical protein